MEKAMLGPPATTSKSKPNSCDEKAPDSSDNGVKKIGWPKGKKRKKNSKDSSDPQKPLTAYHYYFKQTREKLRDDNPTWNHVDIIKKLAEDWKSLTPEQRQQYNVSAEEDKERYNRELTMYKQTDAYKTFVKDKTNKKIKENHVEVEKDDNNYDIPIFTEEFLEHNKIREVELRSLRKQTTEYEQQNTNLEKLIENSKCCIGKLEDEIKQQRNQNTALQHYLDNVRMCLTKAFADIPVSDYISPNIDTIDSYMSELQNILQVKSTSWTYYNQVKEIVHKLDLLG